VTALDLNLSEQEVARVNPTEQPPAGATAPGRNRWLVTGILLAACLSLITGVISYKHGLDVARTTGNTGMVSYLLPLVPDLMIAMSSLVLFVDSLMDAERPRTAIGALAGGIGWTVAQNVAAGWHQGWGGRIIDAGIPLGFVLTFELLLWLFRRFRRAAPGDASVTADGGTVTPEPLDAMAALQALLASESERNLAFMLKVDRMKVRAWQGQLETAGAEPVEDAPAEIRYAALNGSGAHG
jgi:Protein of unknown function (DUF2637)